jgi:cytochrome oxidase assembly protein ShyY1
MLDVVIKICTQRRLLSVSSQCQPSVSESLPNLHIVLSHQAYEFQARRKEDKLEEGVRRTSLLGQQAIDITPQNKGQFVWSKAANLDAFENDYSFKKVKVRGIFDHTREIQVEKMRNGEKGVEIITPFYTHLNEKNEECGILVNRGWVPLDFKDLKMHYTSPVSGEIQGLLYRGDAQTKYSKANEPTILRYHSTNPYDFSLITQMKNQEEASKFMLMLLDTDPNARQILPTAPTTSELTAWRIQPERHEAYATLWKYITFGGIFANTAMWVYF